MKTGYEVPSTSPTLLRNLIGPSADRAWHTFVLRYSPLVEARCRSAGLQTDDMEEIKGQVFAQLIRSLAGFQYDPARRFRGYLSQTVDNTIRSYWKTLQRRPGWIGYGDRDGGEVPEPLTRLSEELDDRLRCDLDQVFRVIDRVKSEVGNENWLAFWLTAIEGLSGIEAAERLQKKPATIYMAKSRVLQKLREAVNEVHPVLGSESAEPQQRVESPQRSTDSGLSSR